MRAPEITVIDYGVGNLLSVSRGLEHCGAKVNMSSDPEYILKSQKVILPGVGAFPNGMRALIELRLDRAINPKITGSNANRIDYYVFSRKVADETNVVVNIKKNPGQTSGGIAKNLNLVKRVDDELANLVSDLKSKIFSTVLVQ